MMKRRNFLATILAIPALSTIPAPIKPMRAGWYTYETCGYAVLDELTKQEILLGDLKIEKIDVSHFIVNS